ncbi:MAG: hypothetical protein ACTSRC_10110, partial [Candidatus Helarchaeota archaeon]
DAPLVVHWSCLFQHEGAESLSAGLQMGRAHFRYWTFKKRQLFLNVQFCLTLYHLSYIQLRNGILLFPVENLN